MCRRLIPAALFVSAALAAGAGVAHAQFGDYLVGLFGSSTGTTTNVYYNHDEDGNFTDKEVKRTENKSGIDNTIRFSCKPPKPCEICSGCHVSDRTVAVPSGASVDRIRELVVASANRHNQTYIPSAVMRLSAGQRVGWGARTYLSRDGGDLVLHRQSGEPLVVYPTGTQVLKRLNGDVIGLYFPPTGEPRIVSRAR